MAISKDINRVEKDSPWEHMWVIAFLLIMKGHAFSFSCHTISAPQQATQQKKQRKHDTACLLSFVGEIRRKYEKRKV